MPVAKANPLPQPQFRAAEPSIAPNRADARAASKSPNSTKKPGAGESFAGALKRSNDRTSATSGDRDAQQTRSAESTDRAPADSNAEIKQPQARDESPQDAAEASGVQENQQDAIDQRSVEDAGAAEPAVEITEPVARQSAQAATPTSETQTTQVVTLVVPQAAQAAQAVRVESADHAGKEQAQATTARIAGRADPAPARDTKLVAQQSRLTGESDAQPAATQTETQSAETAAAPGVEDQTALAVDEPAAADAADQPRAKDARPGSSRALERLLDASARVRETSTASAEPASTYAAPARGADVNLSQAAAPATTTLPLPAAQRAAAETSEAPSDTSRPGESAANSRHAAAARTTGAHAAQAPDAAAPAPAPAQQTSATDGAKAPVVAIAGDHAGRATQPSGAAGLAPRAETSAGTAEDAEALASTVSRGLSAAVSQRGGTITLRLQPESLGSLRIQLDISGGVVDARFETSSAATRDLLNQSVDSLRSALEAKGLGVERIRVELAPSGGAAHTGAQQQSADDAQQRFARENPGRAFSHDAADGRSRGWSDQSNQGRDRSGPGPEDRRQSQAGQAPVFERWLSLGLDAVA